MCAIPYSKYFGSQRELVFRSTICEILCNRSDAHNMFVLTYRQTDVCKSMCSHTCVGSINMVLP